MGRGNIPVPAQVRSKMRRCAAAALLLVAACTGARERQVPSPIAVPHPATVVVEPPRPELTTTRTSVAAGSCATLHLASPDRSDEQVRLQADRAEGWAATPWTARVRDDTASIRVCPAWTGATELRLRAKLPHAASAPLDLTIERAPWMRELDRLIGTVPLSASLVVDGRPVYGHGADVPRRPASNEKLLLSMTALDLLGPGFRIPTAAAGRISHGVVHGDLWVLGHGDPELGREDLALLARRLTAGGLTRITGSVSGDTTDFRRDRGAPGWHPIALRFIGLPTALSFEHNVDAGGYVFDPERRAASALTGDLRALGVVVEGPPRARSAPADLRVLARTRSAPLEDILTRQNAVSDNLDAETISKLLGAHVQGTGSIRVGAHVIAAWARAHGADVRAVDASGLSYRDRVTTADLARLLDAAQAQPWGDALRATLPAPGEGTLDGRLGGLAVRAKTGTLIHDVSALSGYVRLRDGTWASFSIMSALPKGAAVPLEDAIVRLIAANA